MLSSRNYASPEPHFIPGYTGHCPGQKESFGKTFGRVTNHLLVDRCAYHSPDYILTNTEYRAQNFDSPSPEIIGYLEDRARRCDFVYRHPIIIGYGGFLPKMYSKVGKRFISAAEYGVAELDTLVEGERCERRAIEHQDCLQSGLGRFKDKLRERLLPLNRYRAPLTTIKPGEEAIKFNVKYKPLPFNHTESYNKDTPPHFMENDDEQKFIIGGYAGYIPMESRRFGVSHQTLTNYALKDNTNYHRRQRGFEPCPKIDMDNYDPCAVMFDPCASDYEASIKNSYPIYTKAGVIARYGGHVPGVKFSLGQSFHRATRNAMNHLKLCKIRI